MQPVSLQAQLRNTGKGAAHRLRQAGFMPAVLYGQGRAAVPIAVRVRDLERALHSAGRNALFAVELADRNEPATPAVLKELQRHPARRGLLHADFMEVSLSHRLTVRVPIHAEGVEDLEREGLLVQYQTREVDVECLPMGIPDRLTVDVRGMKAGEQLLAASVHAPGDARVASEPHEVILSVVTARAAVVEEEPPAKGEERAPEDTGEE